MSYFKLGFMIWYNMFYKNYVQIHISNHDKYSADNKESPNWKTNFSSRNESKYPNFMKLESIMEEYPGPGRGHTLKKTNIAKKQNNNKKNQQTKIKIQTNKNKCSKKKKKFLLIRRRD